MLTRHSMLLAIFCCTVAGCQTITTGVSTVVHKPFGPRTQAAAEIPVTEMICLWEEAEGIGLDKKPTRGFAGQLMFFSPNKNEPVHVHGDVEIFLFDDLGSTNDQSKPLHTFKFQKEAFEVFKTETNLGVAYQLFLPYVRKSHYKTNCSLRVRVLPAEGQPLFSKMASVNLNGPESPQAIARAKEQKAKIQLAAAEQMEQQQPLAPTSPEQTAAYFGATSLPVPLSDSNVDKQRLKSAFHTVVRDEEVAPKQLPRHARENSTLIKAVDRPIAQHPLLEE